MLTEPSCPGTPTWLINTLPYRKDGCKAERNTAHFTPSNSKKSSGESGCDPAVLADSLVLLIKHSTASLQDS